MAIGGFFKRLLGSGTAVEMSDDPFGAKPAPVVAAASETPPEPRCIVQRDEILDGRSRIAGYRFVVRRFGSSLAPSASEVAKALRAENVAAFAERRLALLPVSAEDWLRGEFRQFVAAQAMFLVSAPAPEADRAVWCSALAAIKAAGGRVAIDGAMLGDAGAMAQADLCLIDFRAYSLQNFEQLMRATRRKYPALSIAVDGLATWPEHRLCMDRRAHYSLGGFAASNDEADAKDKLNQSRLVLIEMLNLLRRDAELSEVADVAKRDPGVALKVVTMANTPMLGLSAPVASLDQAIMVLGRATLYRWLSIALFRAGSSGGRDDTLLEMALWRARFLELLAAGERSRQECDELFLVGLFSLLDSLLATPMAEIVGRMTLPEAVLDVLLNSAGPYGRYLLLALMVEKGRAEQVGRIAGELGLDPEAIEVSSRRARAWADEALAAS